MEEQTRNGWQNTGWFVNKAFDEIPRKYRDTYLWIVRHSVGYGEPFTNPQPIKKIAKKTGRGYNQLIDDIRWLVENKFIKRIGHYGNLKGGGSTPYAYDPIFPKDFHIWLKDEKEKKQKKETEEAKESLEGWE